VKLRTVIYEKEIAEIELLPCEGYIGSQRSPNSVADVASPSCVAGQRCVLERAVCAAHREREEASAGCVFGLPIGVFI
jgi:hypothetical protein